MCNENETNITDIDNNILYNFKIGHNICDYSKIDIVVPDTKYNDIASDIGDVVTSKNKRYGDSAFKTSALMDILYPDGVPKSKYRIMLLLVRILDKVVRLSSGEIDDKSAVDAFRDISGYGILGVSQFDTSE